MRAKTAPDDARLWGIPAFRVKSCIDRVRMAQDWPHPEYKPAVYERHCAQLRARLATVEGPCRWRAQEAIDLLDAGQVDEALEVAAGLL